MPATCSCCPLAKRKPRSSPALGQSLPGSQHRDWGLPVHALLLSVLVSLVFPPQSLECLHVADGLQCRIEALDDMGNQGLTIFLQKEEQNTLSVSSGHRPKFRKLPRNGFLGQSQSTFVQSHWEATEIDPEAKSRNVERRIHLPVARGTRASSVPRLLVTLAWKREAALGLLS